MLTRRSFFKAIATIGCSSMIPGVISAKQIPGPSSTVQELVQSRPGEDVTPLVFQTLDELLDSVDCQELAERYGVIEKESELYRGGPSGACLFCRAGGRGESLVSVMPNEFQCQNCGAIVTAVEFLARVEGITAEEAVSKLAMLVRSGSLKKRRNRQIILWGIMEEATKYYHHILCNRADGEPGRKWLKNHGMTAVEMKEKLYLGYFPRCRDGTQPELIEHLVSLGYDRAAVVYAQLPVGCGGILISIGDAHGHWWGFTKYSFWAKGKTFFYLSDINWLAPRTSQGLFNRSLDLFQGSVHSL
jgi:hypothetical protein